jgi:CelD/BcsL family acetyltransferase involved in cellulose biosynthesis
MPRMVGGCLNPLTQCSERLAAMDVASWGVILPSALAEYNTSILHPSFAKELEKKLRRVAKRGEIEYVEAQTKHEKRIAFQILTRQKQARCDEMGRSNILAQPAYRQFYESA